MLILFSAVFLAVSDLVTKHSLQRMHAMELIGVKGIIMLPLLLVLIPFIDLRQPIEIYIITALVGTLLTFAILYRTKGVRHLDISLTAPLMNFSPIFVLALGIVFLQEYPTSRQLIGILLLVVGAYAVQVKSSRNLLEPISQMLSSRYIQYIIFALLAFSVTAMIDRFTLTTYTVTPVTYLFLVWLFASLIAIGLDVYNYGTADLVYDLRNRKLPVILIAVCILISSLLFLEGVSRPEAYIALAIPLKRTSTLMVTLIGGNMFHEQHIWRKAISCIIMIVGVLIIVT